MKIFEIGWQPLLSSFLWIISSFVFNFNSCNALAVEESSTGAIITFPEVLDGDLSNKTWEVEPAAFGFADYGGTLEGICYFLFFFYFFYFFLSFANHFDISLH